jgi:hypothetical protein
MPSYSRPRVSNDNPFSEALFKTLKYRGDWPSSGLDGEILEERKLVLEEARKANPNRWSGSVRNCEPIGAVMLNADRDKNTVLKMTG